MDQSRSKTSMTLMRRLTGETRDDQAWTEFLAIYGPRIDRWCRKRGLQEADVQDVTQNVLAKLARRFDTFEYDPSRRFRAWLRTVTEHAIIDFVNSRPKSTPGDPMEILATVESRQDLMQSLSDAFDLELLAEARVRVREQVDRHHWEVYQLATDQQNRAATVAQQTGESVANVFKIKSRIKRMIQEQMQVLDPSFEE
ncbi:MAG: sigma-70 family RNA polymerase sigma factor [Planctomycetota bacterium]